MRHKNIAYYIKLTCIILIVALILLTSISFNQNSKYKIVLNKVETRQIKEQEMETTIYNPVYTAQDNNNRNFSINAQRAINSESNNIKLENIMANIYDKNIGNINANATNGIFNNTEKTLELNGDVNIVTYNGAQISTKNALYDAKKSLIFSQNPILYTDNNIYLQASHGIEVFDNGSKIIFNGPVKVRLWNNN